MRENAGTRTDHCRIGFRRRRGIQADIKTVTALDGFAMTAITALTAQNTLGVEGIAEIAPEFVVKQIDMVLSDIGADAIKIGMLHRKEVVDAVATYFDETEDLPPVVLDPVMIAKGGASLIAVEAGEAIKNRLIGPHTYLLTPNIPEAEQLTGMTIRSRQDLEKAGRRLLDLGPVAVLMKGGHAEGQTVTDLLISPQGVETFNHPRIDSKHTHGTGCTLSSAIATGLAQGLSASDAVGRAIRYVEVAIRQAPGYGAGHGPMDHGHTVIPFN